VLKTVGITRPPQTAGINGGLSIFNWFVAMTGAGLVERVGRRKLFLTSIGGMLGCFCLITALAGAYNGTKVKSTGVAMVPFIFFFMGFYSLAFTPLPMLYTPEISPLTLRAKSAALLLLSQNCAQALNQFANPIALKAIGWKYYFVYIGVLCVYFVLFYKTIRETRGLTTEEAAVVYESDEVREAAMAEERRLHEEAAFLPEDTGLELKKSIQEDEVKKEGV
jgi:MFS family permease